MEFTLTEWTEIGRTDKAVKVAIYGKTIWVPLSALRYTAHGVWIPEWLAMDRGLMTRRQMYGTGGKARSGWHAQLRAEMPGRAGALAVAADVA